MLPQFYPLLELNRSNRVGQQPQPLLLLCINLLKGAPDYSLLFSKMIV